MKKSKWINLPVFWKNGSIIFLLATIIYFVYSFWRGFDRLDLAIVLLGILIVFVMQVEYLLFRYFEHKKIDARHW